MGESPAVQTCLGTAFLTKSTIQVIEYMRGKDKSATIWRGAVNPISCELDCRFLKGNKFYSGEFSLDMREKKERERERDGKRHSSNYEEREIHLQWRGRTVI